MADIDEQRKRVEELKRKILEQKKKGDSGPALESPGSNPVSDIKEPAAPLQSQVQEVKPQDNGASQHRSDEAVHKVEKTAPRQPEQVKRNTEPEKNGQTRQTVPVASLQAYAQTLKEAWANGSLSKDEENLLATLRKSMGITEQEHASLEQEVRLEIYLYAIVDSWKNGSLTVEDLDRLDLLREKFHISAEEHMRLEKQVRQEIVKHH
jgi:hypothetical protein